MFEQEEVTLPPWRQKIVMLDDADGYHGHRELSKFIYYYYNFHFPLFIFMASTTVLAI
jgi:hypothetical protein